MTRNLGSGTKKETSPPAAIHPLSWALIFLPIIALAAVAYSTQRGVVASRDWVLHSYEVRSQLNDLQLEGMRAEANQMAYLFSSHEQQSPQFRHPDLAGQTVDTLRKLTADNPRQQQRLNELGQILQEKQQLTDGQVKSDGIRVRIPAEDRKSQDEISERQRHFNSIVKSMQEEEQLLLNQRRISWKYLFKRSVIMLAMAFAIMVIMLAYNFWLFMTEIARTRETAMRARANAQSFRLMSARILELQDSERRRIARELHDSVGQYLAGLKINLNQLEPAVRGKAQKMLEETITLTDYAIQDVRTISHLLHPPLLDEVGFLAAARWYVDECRKRGEARVSLNIDEPIERLPKTIEIALFRVLQESLTNVYRHACAQFVDVSILSSEGCVKLTVTDDGKGIPEDVLAKFDAGAALGIGLAGMRERLAEFGGELRVKASSSGSKIEATIPTSMCAAEEQRAA